MIDRPPLSGVPEFARPAFESEVARPRRHADHAIEPREATAPAGAPRAGGPAPVFASAVFFLLAACEIPLPRAAAAPGIVPGAVLSASAAGRSDTTPTRSVDSRPGATSDGHPRRPGDAKPAQFLLAQLDAIADRVDALEANRSLPAEIARACPYGLDSLRTIGAEVAGRCRWPKARAHGGRR